MAHSSGGLLIHNLAGYKCFCYYLPNKWLKTNVSMPKLRSFLGIVWVRTKFLAPRSLGSKVESNNWKGCSRDQQWRGKERRALHSLGDVIVQNKKEWSKHYLQNACIIAILIFIRNRRKDWEFPNQFGLAVVYLSQEGILWSPYRLLLASRSLLFRYWFQKFFIRLHLLIYS